MYNTQEREKEREKEMNMLISALEDISYIAYKYITDEDMLVAEEKDVKQIEQVIRVLYQEDCSSGLMLLPHQLNRIISAARCVEYRTANADRLAEEDKERDRLRAETPDDSFLNDDKEATNV